MAGSRESGLTCSAWGHLGKKQIVGICQVPEFRVSERSGRAQPRRQAFLLRQHKLCGNLVPSTSDPVGFCTQETPSSISGADPEETILNAFKVFDPEGKGVLKAD